MSDRLWAPWRLSYIEGTPKAEGETGCIFVDLPNQTDDRANLILFRGITAYILLNAFPYTNGHLMVAPYRHTSDITTLSDDELLEINQLIASAVKWIREAYKPDGFNIGVNIGRAAGAGIPTHIHWHIVPRWDGDTNFMGVVGDVRVLPQSLEESYDRLKLAADRIG
jgi:ATP adenylyltransferase